MHVLICVYVYYNYIITTCTVYDVVNVLDVGLHVLYMYMSNAMATATQHVQYMLMLLYRFIAMFFEC